MPHHRILKNTENGWEFTSPWLAAAMIAVLLLVVARLETVL